MFIHVVSRPLSDVTHVPRSGVRALVDSIRRAGGEADFDFILVLGVFHVFGEDDDLSLDRRTRGGHGRDVPIAL